MRTRSLRVAVTHATGLGWGSGDGLPSAPRVSTTPIVSMGLDCGQVLAALESAPEPAREWMLVAYGLPDYVSQRMRERVFERLRAAVAAEKGQPRTSRFLPFVRAAAGAVARRNLTRRGVTFSAIAREAGIDPRSKGRWQPYYDAVEHTIDHWEEEAARAAKRYLRDRTHDGIVLGA